MADTVLLVDRSASTRQSLSRQLGRIDCEIIEAEGMTQALQAVRRSSIRVALLDLESLSEKAPILVAAIKRECPDAAVILLAGPKHIHLSIQCMKLGALDDLAVPLDADALVSRVSDALAGEAGGRRSSADARRGQGPEGVGGDRTTERGG